jgi:hypothetical protein
MRLSKFTSKLLYVIGKIMSLGIFIGFVTGIVWFGYTGFKYWFTQKDFPFSVNLTDFRSLEANGDSNCNIESKFHFPIEVTISRQMSNMLDTHLLIQAKNLQEFSIDFADGTLSGTAFLDDGTSESLQINEPDKYITGKAEQLSIEYLDLDYFQMFQYFCESQISIYTPGAGYYLSSHPSNFMKSVGIVQYLPQDSLIKVTVINATNLSGVNLNNSDRVEFIFRSNNDYFPLYLFSKAADLQATLPSINSLMSGHIIEGVRIFSDEIRISAPIGNLRYGNNDPIELVQIASSAKDELFIPRTKVNGYGNTYIVKWRTFGNTEITGTSRSLLLNDEDLGNAPWDELPEYVQAGLFGLLLSILGALRALRQRIWNGLISLFSFSAKNISPPKNSFVCVTASGITIAGELCLQPDKTHPYYVITNARRKLKPSDKWEKEIIPEIKVRSDAVEQYYEL